MHKSELVGAQVTIHNPHIGMVWEGRAIAYTDQPTFLIEQADGFRLMLPAAWAIAADPTPPEAA